MKRERGPAWTAFLLLAAVSCSHAASSEADAGPEASAPAACPVLTADSWPEADALFTNDPTWLGADAAYSVDLGHQRVLWLFGDTYLAKSSARSREDAWFIRNSLAIQSVSYDPSQASAAFRWGGTASMPDSYFPESGSQWSWPLAGIRLPSKLVLFLLSEAASTGGLGFAAQGTKVVFVSDPDSDPSGWQVTDGNLPAFPFPVAFGAAVATDGTRVYAFSDQEPGDHSVYVARFSVEDLDGGDASAPEWWAGDRGWVDAGELGTAGPAVIFPSATTLQNPPTELSVTRRADGTWVAVHSVGFGATQLAVRTAPSATGPWSSPCIFFTPPESGVSGVLVYAGKGHAELTGANLVATYATNGNDATSNLSLYFPRFVRANGAL